MKTQNRELSLRCIAYNIHRLTNLIIIFRGFSHVDLISKTSFNYIHLIQQLTEIFIDSLFNVIFVPIYYNQSCTEVRTAERLAGLVLERNLARQKTSTSSLCYRKDRSVRKIPAHMYFRKVLLEHTSNAL